MERPFLLGTCRWCLAVCMLSSLVAPGCSRNQIKTLANAVQKAKGTPEEKVEAVAEASPVSAPPLPEATDQAAAASGAAESAINVDPGSGRDVKLVGGFRMTPPETFNVIFEEEGSDFRANYWHYRWERQSGGAWFIVTFLSGMDYEGGRMPNLEDERVVRQRIQTAFARVDKGHQLRSNGSQAETLAGLKTIRTNVVGKVAGEDAVGHLYLLTDGQHLVEIAALATESNRDALKACRDSANSLARAVHP